MDLLAPPVASRDWIFIRACFASASVASTSTSRAFMGSTVFSVEWDWIVLEQSAGSVVFLQSWSMFSRSSRLTRWMSRVERTGIVRRRRRRNERVTRRVKEVLMMGVESIVSSLEKLLKIRDKWRKMRYLRCLAILSPASPFIMHPHSFYTIKCLVLLKPCSSMFLSIKHFNTLQQ